MSIVPSVCLFITIPESVEYSWYTGNVHVGLKEAVFEPSSSLRHAAEVYNLLTDTLETCPVSGGFKGGPRGHVPPLAQTLIIFIYIAVG